MSKPKAEEKGRKEREQREQKEEKWFENKETGNPGYVSAEAREADRQGANNREIAEALKTLGNKAPGTLGDTYMRGRRDALRELAESGGLPQSQLGLEVLFLLPDAFVRFYSDLFHRALIGGGGQAVSGKGGGIDKSPGQTGGMVLGSSNRLQAQGTGKRFKNQPAVLGKPEAVRLKTTIDKELMALVSAGSQVLRSHRSKGDVDAKPAPLICSGSLPGLGEGRESEVRKCSRFLKKGWNYCPNCGKVVDGEKK